MKPARGVLVFSLVSLLGAAAAPLPPQAFAYDAKAPLQITIVKNVTQSGVRKQEMTFASPAGGRVHGEIVSALHPTRTHAGVLFVHWLGDPATTNLKEFEPDAVALAHDGVTSVLVDAMWSQPHWFTRIRSTQTDYDASIKQVIELRRALDVLQRQPGVDSRIAYVGHDFGAMYGAVLSGVDPRPQFFVLMAGTTSFSEWYLLGKKPADVDAYVAQMAPLEPLPYLQRSKARGYYFQFSQKDDYISPQEETAFFEAAPFPRTMSVYDADHGLKPAVVRADRLTWLREKLEGG